MTKHLISLAAALALATPSIAQEEADAAPSPNEIVAQAEADEWVAIAPEDLLVMTLASDAEGNERKVVIQLMPAPFSAAWTANIRKFARAGWYDDITVNRVQDNYVVQWGDANYDNPEASGEPKGLPEGLLQTDEADYSLSAGVLEIRGESADKIHPYTKSGERWGTFPPSFNDPYSTMIALKDGWPLGIKLSGTSEYEATAWPVHCYGMVGVGRNLTPDAGTGAELYTVIGHAPRHLDRNIALVGRIVEGIEHLSSLPRGKGVLGFYEDESRRTPILTVRVASELPEGEQPAFEYLDTEGTTFAAYADARANRRDPFFNVPAGGADICNIPVPIRRVAE
ncbi:MAG: peptidylprolyl isomerase [Erythrobacter sp.]|nr:peptidylprolyl isomerase [Erythrobacter sp.]